mmetsp:Transcript_7156/g.13112  ORF Transcript_7156/g.13112 Transcript_7156/m.13112 type:complete len:130 (+) Transcript_7156:2199-2588(+)
MELQIDIPSYHKVGTGRSAFTIYRVELRIGDWSHVVEKRYSDFHELHRVMKLMSRVINDKLPHFPGQKIFKHLLGSLTEGDIQERRTALENYMRLLTRTVSAKSSHFFPEFLQIPPTIYNGWLRRTGEF